MTNKLKHFEQPISKLLEARDFNSLLNLFAAESFQFNELIIFYKRNDKIFNFPVFWKSDLPHFFLEEIFKSDLKVDFLRAFLSKNENGSDSLFQHIASIAKPDLIRHIKIWKAFNHSSFWNYIQENSQKDDEIKKLFQVLEIIKSYEAEIKKEEYNDDLLLFNFDLSEIFLAITLFYYDFKQGPGPTDNKSFQIQIETTLVDEISRILRLFLIKGKRQIKPIINQELQKEFELHKAPHFKEGKKGIIVPLPEKFKVLFTLFERMINRNSKRGIIRIFLSGMAEFQSVRLNPAPLKTNSNYTTFQRNDLKGGPEASYFVDQTKLYENPSKELRIETDIEIRLLDFQGVPRNLKISETLIDFQKILKLLKVLSVYKGPLERCFVETEKELIVLPMNEGDGFFVDLFGQNESISVFEIDTFQNMIQQYFKLKKEEVTELLQFLIWDINGGIVFPNWLYYPLLKSGNQVYWLGSFLKDRRWDTIIFNKLREVPMFKSQVNIQTKEFERKIREAFASKSFTTFSHEFFLADGRKGDFDLLAYKDGFLFVVEAKTSLLSNDFSHAHYSEAVTLEGCAVGQLRKSMDRVKEDWENIKNELLIPDNYIFSDVKLVPLIVTNHFEGDMKLFGESIRKVSFLEIQVILTNSKRRLLEMHLRNKLNTNRSNPNLKSTELPEFKWDLWDGQTKFQPKFLIDAIDSNAVWKEIEDLWNFEQKEFLIDY